MKPLAHSPVLMAFLAASLEIWCLFLKYIKVNRDTVLEGALSRGVSQGLTEKTQTGLLPHISFPLERSNLILSIAPDPLPTTTCLYILGSAGCTLSVTCHLDTNDRTTGAHHRCWSHTCTPLLQTQFPAGSYSLTSLFFTMVMNSTQSKTAMAGSVMMSNRRSKGSPGISGHGILKTFMLWA